MRNLLQECRSFGPAMVRESAVSRAKGLDPSSPEGKCLMFETRSRVVERYSNVTMGDDLLRISAALRSHPSQS
jgi:hypothetical protein